MKYRIPLFLAATLAATVLALSLGNPSAALAVYVLWFAATNLLAPAAPRLCTTTLTVAEILTDVLEAFKTRVPGMNFLAHDFSSARVKFGQQIIAHLPTIPTAYSHVAASGYRNNAQNARDLLTDVPITMDGWTDVPIKILHDDATEDRSENYLKTISNAGYVLGKTVVDFALSKIVAANFSQSTTESTANTTLDTLGKMRLAMNGVNAGAPRNILCSSAFFTALDQDPRVASGDYHGQIIGGSPFGRLMNVGGFAEVAEYPALPTNSQNLAAFGFDERALGIATRLPVDSADLADRLGIPVTFKREVVQDPESGLAIQGFAEIDPNTHNIYIVSTIMYGAIGGAQGGGAGTLTDYAGHRVVTA
jgi:hypothetical protein